MSTHVSHSNSPDALKAGNGVDEDTQPKPPERKYKLEDFSQSAINRGQQYINYELTEVNKRIAEAFEAIRDVIVGPPGNPTINSSAVQLAIDEVKKANDKVAGWYPPGCSSGGSNEVTIQEDPGEAEAT